MKILNGILGTLCAVCLITVFLYFSVASVAYDRNFYSAQYDKNGTMQIVDMTKQDLMQVTDHMILYLRGKTPGLNILTVVGGQTRMFFSEREITHMVDVLAMLDFGRTASNTALVLLVMLAGAVVWLNRKKAAKILAKGFVFASSTVGTLLLALGICCAVDFDGTFTMFHELFFKNDLWILDKRVDLLVNIVPTEFFFDISLRIGAVFLLLTLLALTASIVIVIKGRKSNA